MIMMRKQVFFDILKTWVPAVNTTMIMIVLLVVGISTNLVASKSIKHQGTCQQVGKPEENVTLMYGMHHPNVKHALIGHVRTLKECVNLACRRENTTLAYTSRFDCFSVTCNGDEELCWFLPSFKNPSLIFARLGRTNQDDVKKSNDKKSAKENKSKAKKTTKISK